MKKVCICMALAMLMIFPATVFAIGVEFAVGGWRQTPDGNISYEADTDADDLDISDDLNYPDESQLTARLKLDMPLLIPNIYLMVSPMNFSGDGNKAVDFKFGDVEFQGNVDFYSELTLDTYDLALYYGIPFVKTATAGLFNVDLGLNLRVVDFYGKVKQDDTNLEESADYTLPIPMVYAGVQVTPWKRLAVEGELRAITYGGNFYYSLIGRVKVQVFGPLFAAVGYRRDNVQIDVDDFEADATFGGALLEAGFKF